MRTSLSKSTYSINTKLTPQARSRQASYTPYTNSSHRNGHLSFDASLPKKTPRPRKSDSTDTFEMKTLASQRPTLEAFNELEQLVPNTTPNRAVIAEMSSLLYDQEDSAVEILAIRRSTLAAPS